MIIASVSTRHFDFTAVADSVEHANDALIQGWAQHASQTGAEPDMMAEMIADGDVNHLEIEPGHCARDGSVL